MLMKLFKRKYSYLISYQFQGGTGSAFIIRDKRIKSQADVEGINKSLIEYNPSLVKIAVNNFCFLGLVKDNFNSVSKE